MSQDKDTQVRLRYYRSTLKAVALAGKKYLDELERHDQAHGGRMSKIENELRSAAFECMKAWDDRFAPLSDLQRAYAPRGPYEPNS